MAKASTLLLGQHLVGVLVVVGGDDREAQAQLLVGHVDRLRVCVVPRETTIVLPLRSTMPETLDALGTISRRCPRRRRSRASSISRARRSSSPRGTRPTRRRSTRPTRGWSLGLTIVTADDHEHSYQMLGRRARSMPSPPTTSWLYGLIARHRTQDRFAVVGDLAVLRALRHHVPQGHAPGVPRWSNRAFRKLAKTTTKNP